MLILYLNLPKRVLTVFFFERSYSYKLKVTKIFTSLGLIVSLRISIKCVISKKLYEQTDSLQHFVSLKLESNLNVLYQRSLLINSWYISWNDHILENTIFCQGKLNLHSFWKLNLAKLCFWIKNGKKTRKT